MDRMTKRITVSRENRSVGQEAIYLHYTLTFIGFGSNENYHTDMGKNHGTDFGKNGQDNKKKNYRE